MLIQVQTLHMWTTFLRVSLLLVGTLAGSCRQGLWDASGTVCVCLDRYCGDDCGEYATYQPDGSWSCEPAPDPPRPPTPAPALRCYQVASYWGKRSCELSSCHGWGKFPSHDACCDEWTCAPPVGPDLCWFPDNWNPPRSCSLGACGGPYTFNSHTECCQECFGDVGGCSAF